MWPASLIFRIRREEVNVERRGFRVPDAAARRHLENIGLAFLSGYHAALKHVERRLPGELGQLPLELQGFAHEGAAMAYSLLDGVSLQRRRFRTFLAGNGAAHIYMAHVGAGWAMARLPWIRAEPMRHLRRFDPVLRWLVLDGYGFHDGYFHWPASVRRQTIPRQLTGYARRAYDQGLGRSLWFSDGTEVCGIAKTIASFPAYRHSDLWSGVGLACAYAGGGSASAAEQIRTAAGEHWVAAAQGAVFAAACRERAANPARHTETACHALCGCDALTAANIAFRTREGLPHDRSEPAFELWRGRIRNCLGVERTAA